jgi:hypothetical protein
MIGMLFVMVIVGAFFFTVGKLAFDEWSIWRKRKKLPPVGD